MVTFCLLISSQAIGGEILIATVAQVKNHVITSREVQIHYLLDKSLGTPKEFFRDQNPVEQNIREWLLFYEARAFYNTKLSNHTVKINSISLQTINYGVIFDFHEIGFKASDSSSFSEFPLNLNLIIPYIEG